MNQIVIHTNMHSPDTNNTTYLFLNVITDYSKKTKRQSIQYVKKKV